MKRNGWDKMWFTARSLRQFTRLDLITICGQTDFNVREFTKTYRDLGYLKASARGGPGVVWTLVKDAGPVRPQAGRRRREAGDVA